MEKENWKKEAKINRGILIFFYTINMATLQVHAKFEDPVSNRTEKAVTEFCQREKWTNKRTDINIKSKEKYELTSKACLWCADQM